MDVGVRGFEDVEQGLCVFDVRFAGSQEVDGLVSQLPGAARRWVMRLTTARRKSSAYRGSYL